jgi:hypothetical protein
LVFLVVSFLLAFPPISYINKDIGYRKVISYTNVTKLKTTGKHLFKTKCKWKTTVGAGELP